jgi:hypothetical protein
MIVDKIIVHLKSKILAVQSAAPAVLETPGAPCKMSVSDDFSEYRKNAYMTGVTVSLA